MLMPTTTPEASTNFVTLEGAANALAVNRDATQVVVAGRNVFKIFNIEPDRFVEKLNLRIGKNVDLSYSCADIVWNPVDDAVMATAATNGSVVTWNLNSNLKQDMKFYDHKRTVNKVCFHNSDAHFLLSGSQDGTMKLFDLRKKEATSTFYSLSESVRDVQFCPHHYFAFAAVQENGYVQLWDLRRTDRFERQFAAHSGPVFTCDWHPEQKWWLATAGRDKTIKVWDTCFKENLEHCIQTIASVSKVKWRPLRKFNIASSSLVVDYNVNVWDIRRPYVPFASFIEHKDVALDLPITGFAWRNVPNLLVTTSKDCTLYQHLFKDAARPADHANPVGLDIDPLGDLCYAANEALFKNQGLNPKGQSSSIAKLPTFLNKKTPNFRERFRASLSALMVLKNGHKHLSMTWFIETARRYILHGKSLPDLCEHNASVALNLQRPHVSQTWQILKLLYSSGSTILSEYSHLNSQDKTQDDKSLDSSQEISKQPNRLNDSTAFRSHHNSGKTLSRHVSGSSYVTTDHRTGVTENSNHNNEEDSDSGGNNEHESSTLTFFATESSSRGDFFFGDREAELFRLLDYSQLSTLPADEDWSLPREAFNIRHPLGDGSPPPEIATIPSSPLCAADEISEREFALNEEEEQDVMLSTCTAPKFPPWNFTPSVIEMLEFYAEQGDVQMTVSILLVIGDKLQSEIDENLLEQWFYSYLDLLSQFELWNVANEVISLSNLPVISSLNQQSTIVHSLCANCNKFTSSVGWICDGCKEISICSICHQITRGLFVWCQGCAHGGHVQHIQEWFQENRQCPTGCGHECEYT